MNEDTPLTKADLTAGLNSVVTQLREYFDERSGSLETKLRRHIDERAGDLETKLRQHIDERAGDLETKLRQHIDERAGDLEAKLRQHIDERAGDLEANLHDYIDERTRDMQTELLRAFADYSDSASVRFRKIEADTSNIDTSTAMRLGELERQLVDFKLRLMALESRR